VGVKGGHVKLIGRSSYGFQAIEKKQSEVKLTSFLERGDVVADWVGVRGSKKGQ